MIADIDDGIRGILRQDVFEGMRMNMEVSFIHFVHEIGEIMALK